MGTKSWWLAGASVLVGCVGSIGNEAAKVTISGRVFSSLCGGQDDVRVRSLDDIGEIATTDADGAFTFASIPMRSTLLVTGAGFVPTISSERTYVDGQADVELAAVPEAFSGLFHGLAGGFELTDNVGTVVVAAVDQGPLPVEGVEITLVDADGHAIAANQRRLYVETTTAFFDFQQEGATRNSGIAAFFEVPTGTYRVESKRDGYVFPTVTVRVRGNTVTLELVHGSGEGAVVPTLITGKVSGTPPYPLMGSVGWLEGVVVTLHGVDGTEVSATTDANGAYELSVPFMRRDADITFAKPGYGALRTNRVCIPGATSNISTRLDTTFDTNSLLSSAYGVEPIQAGTGVVVAYADESLTSTSEIGLVGATVTLEPSLREAFYGEDVVPPMRCAIELCGAGDSCPSGSRCQAGECVTGENGPSCDSCDETETCPAGYSPYELPHLDSDTNYGCYCEPTPATCDLTSPTCEDGTYCVKYRMPNMSTNEWEDDGAICRYYRPLLTATSHYGDTTLPTPVYFVNVPAGTYKVGGTSPAGELWTGEVRVSEGVATALRLFVRAE